MKSASTRRGTLFYTIVALIAAIFIGLFLRFFCGQGVTSAISDNLLTPAKTMYLNALKLVVGPVVFCSIAASVAGISDYKAYGRVGLKVILIYIFTSLVAICIGIAIGRIFNPGAGAVLTSAAEYTVTPTEVSLRDTIVAIVPNNLITPFAEANMTQIIFLSLLIGWASGTLAQKSGMPQFAKALTLLHKLFLTIASLILKLIPLGTFCAVALLIIEIDVSMLLSLLKLIGCVFLGAAVMVCFYGLMFSLTTRQNPLRLFRKCLPNMASFALFCSTSAVLPQTLDTCTNDLGIDPEISSFSIPLGSTINMDGACIYLTVSALFLAGIYDVTLTPDMLIQLALTTLLLSVGAPPLPGSGFICLSVLVLQLGIPIDAIGYLLGIDQLMSMCRTVINGSGDMVCTSIVACTEKRMDLNIFKK